MPYGWVGLLLSGGQFLWEINTSPVTGIHVNPLYRTKNPLYSVNLNNEIVYFGMLWTKQSIIC